MKDFLWEKPASILARSTLVITATLIITVCAVEHARLHGRLLLLPFYDDVGYFNDGWERLLTLRSHGIITSVGVWASNPPHAPLETLLAMASFAVAGHSAMAPYVANGLIVILLLGSIDWLIGDALPAGQRALILMMAALTNLPDRIVENFRPDLLWGISLALACIVTLRRSVAGASIYRCWQIGGLFALALLAKPSVLPVSGVLLVLTLALSTLCDYASPDWPGWDNARKSKAACVGILLSLIAPYYFFAGQATFQYIYANIFTARRALWEYPGSNAEQYWYYIGGPGGIQMIGLSMALLGAILLAGTAHLMAAKDWRWALRVGCIALVAGVAYLIPSIERVKNQFFGAAFQSFALFGACASLAVIVQRWPRMKWAGIACAAVALALFCIPVHGRQRRDLWSTGAPVIVQGNRLADEVYRALPTDRSGPVALATEARTLNEGTLEWMAEDQGKAMRFIALPSVSDAIAVVTADPGTAAHDPGEQISAADEKTWDMAMRAQKGFDLLATVRNDVPGGDGKIYHVFRRR